MMHRISRWGDEMLLWSPDKVLESVVKNCGQTIHDEVASKLTMEELKDLFKVKKKKKVPKYFFHQDHDVAQARARGLAAVEGSDEGEK